jgi:two-component system, OmpR family, sensor kinase
VSVAVVLLAAIGFCLATVVIYHEAARFLVKRVDRELASAAQNPNTIFRGAFPVPTRGSGANVPVGTYAEFRDTQGDVLRQTPPVGELGSPRLPSGALSGPRIFTVHSPHYRVATEPAQLVGDPGQGVAGTLIIAIPMRDIDDTLHHLLWVEWLVALGVLAALGLSAWWVVRLALRPLEHMGATTDAIAEGDLSRRVDNDDPHTEVGRLGRALNAMLGQIERAFAERTASEAKLRTSEARLRRFVADASHELRTPLTSIRGYAELFRRGASTRPDDLAKTMNRIEEEAVRMGVLVDDLLLLARLDEGRPLEHAPVDLTVVAGAAVDDLRVRAPDRPVSFEPSGAVIVQGDDHRLRQVLTNLLENARTHTPPTTPVEVRVRATVDHAVIEVEDSGPGMTPEKADHAFERFWRADPSRARASGGSGLGLAIVAAIIDAHGGTAEVHTAPGAGATFRLSIPRTNPAHDPTSGSGKGEPDSQVRPPKADRQEDATRGGTPSRSP